MADRFGHWLQEKYGTVAALNGAWRRRLASFDEVRPPEPLAAERPDDLPPHLDWLQFADAELPADDNDSVLSYLPDVATTMSASGGLTQLYFRVRAVCRQRPTTGKPGTLADLRKVIPPDADLETMDFAVRAALMHGAVADPRRLPEGCDGASLAPVLETLRHEAWELDRKVLILYPRVYAHLKHLAAQLRASGRATDGCGFGLQRPIHLEGPALLKKFIDLTARARLSFDLGDTRLPLETLRRHALVICPTLEVMSSSAMVKLEQYVRDGGFLAIGPRIPLLSEQMRSDDTLARHFVGPKPVPGSARTGQKGPKPARRARRGGLSEFALALVPCGDGGFFTLPGHVSAETISLMAFESGLAKGLTADAPQLDSAVHRCGARRLLCVANLLDVAATTTFSGEAVSELRDFETTERQPFSHVGAPLAGARKRPDGKGVRGRGQAPPLQKNHRNGVPLNTCVPAGTVRFLEVL